MSYALFFILLLFLSQAVMKAQPVVDSLKAELSNLSGSDRITILLELTKELRFINSAQAIEYSNETFELLVSHPDADYEIEALYQAGWAYIYQRKFETALIYAVRIDSLALIQNHEESFAKSYILNGRVFREKGEYETSLINFNSALELTKNSPNTQIRIVALNETGAVYRRQGNYALANNLHSEAAELAKEHDDKLSLSTSLDRLGIINILMGNYDEALQN